MKTVLYGLKIKNTQAFDKIILKRKEKRFYPTRMTIQIANGLNDYEQLHKDNKGFIIVETNYRIYAYTSNL